MLKRQKILLFLLLCVVALSVLYLFFLSLPTKTMPANRYLGADNHHPQLAVGEIDIFTIENEEKVIPISFEEFKNVFSIEEAITYIQTATKESLVERFGYPTRFNNAHIRYFPEQYLPSHYYMDYPGADFKIVHNKLAQIEIRTPGIAYKGIQIGSSYQDVLDAGFVPSVIHENGDFQWRTTYTFYHCETLPLGEMFVSKKWKMFYVQNKPLHFIFKDDQLNKITIYQQLRDLPASKSTPWEKPEDIVYTDLTRSWWHRITGGGQCIRNLQQVYAGMQNYTENSRGEFYPPVYTPPGPLTFDISSVYPAHIDNLGCFGCPTVSMEEEGITGQQKQFQDSYWYLGYSIGNERSAVAFLSAYYSALGTQEFETNALPIPKHAQAVNHLTLLQLRQGIERFSITDISNPEASTLALQQLPILIEKPGHHSRMGGHVLYMDGHVEWRDYPGPFPMTPAFIEGLYALEERLQKEYPEAFE